MSEQNIYKDHYELQQAHVGVTTSLQNIYGALIGHVATAGEQLSLQEVIDRVVAKLAGAVEEVVEDAVETAVEAVEEAVAPKKARKAS